MSDLLSKKTSPLVEKVVIGLLNRVFRAENIPIELKAVSTIYINSNIFKDAQRYPIDAPYRNFYQYLTEVYVPENSLDSIFFNGSDPKEGYYFYKYSFNEGENIINLFQKTSDLPSQIENKYLPMLHSVLTGQEIEWNHTAINSTKNALVANKSEKNVLLVFGKHDYDNYDYSWLLTFQIHSIYNLIPQTEKLYKKIIEDYLTIILNSIDGVLFSELNDFVENKKNEIETIEQARLRSSEQERQVEILVEENKRIRQKNILLKEFEAAAIAHRHTISNLRIKDFAKIISVALQDKRYELAAIGSKILENLTEINQIALFSIFDTHSLNSTQIRKSHPLKNWSLLKIINLLINADLTLYQVFPDDAISLEYDCKIDEKSIYDFKPKESDLSHIFLVLFNLFLNAANSMRYVDFADKYWVKVFVKDEDVCVSFKNKGEINKEDFDFLIEKSKGRTLLEKEKGISIIKYSMQELRWGFLYEECFRKDGFTQITIITKF